MAGQQWLRNFDEHDVPTATVLLDSLRFVTLSRLRQGLVSRLSQLVEARELATPAVVLPERGLDDFDLTAEELESPVAYRDFHPGDEMSITPGSEGFVGAVLRDFPGVRRTQRDAPWIAPQATFEDLRERRCRSVVIVTDYIGSGGRVLDLAAAIARHPTIRSWRSFRWLDIHAATFASSPAAIDRLQNSDILASVWTVEGAPTFATASWTADVRDAIVDLCRTKCLINRHMALGYGGSAGLFVTERGAPNNLPAVLWQTAAGWEPLFPNRTVPTALARDLGGYRSGDSLTELAERVGQLRLGRNQRLDNMRGTSRSLLRALLLLERGPRDTIALAAELALDVTDTEALRECLKQLGLIDATGAITDRGRGEIAANKRGMRRTTAGLSGSDAPYYPHSLR